MVSSALEHHTGCDTEALTYLPAMHWVQHEAAPAVNNLLLAFLH